MRKIFLSLLMASLSILALASVASACRLGWYQPRIPKSME